MVRIISSVLAAATLWLTSTGSVQQSRERAAAAVAATRLQEWFGAPPSSAVGPGARTHGWVMSAFDVSPQRAVMRGLVEPYTAGLLADRPLGDALTAYLTDRLTEEVFQHQTVSTMGAGFLIERYFGGTIPYAVRSVRLTRQQLEPSEPFPTLERYLGTPTLDEILHECYRRHGDGPASRADFIALSNEVSGRDLDWLFAATSGDEGALDYGVGHVTTGPSTDGRRRTTIEIRRYGDAVFAGTDRAPDGAFESGRAVAVRVVFADGTIRDEHWDGRSRWTTFVYDSAPAVAQVIVDPDRVIAGDYHATNNTWTRAPRAGAAADKWAARWMNWLADALLGWAFFV